MDRRRSLSDFRLADVVDRSFQPPRRRFDRYLHGAAQIETAACADIMRDQFLLSERSYPAAADGTSVAQAAAMPEARNSRGESPRPPKVRRPILGEAQSAKLGPGRTAPAGALAQRQQKRRQRSLRHRHRRYRLGRNPRANAEPGREFAWKPHVEAGRPHAPAQPEHAGERPRCDAVRDREAMEPARQQFVGLRAEGGRPTIPRDIQVSFADLDGEARFWLTADHRAAAPRGVATPGRNRAHRSRFW